MSKAEFTCSLNDRSEPLPHFWQHTVGSGHATLALRADWQKQLNRCHEELGFHYVRFHGVLDDDMGTLMRENDELVYSFFNADQICDFLLSINMKPFMELSFMPSTLSSGTDTVFHYSGNITPPRDYAAWALLIEKLVRHWLERYGLAEVRQWFFEIWNEPNLKAFWTGSREEYFKLYQSAARAIKRVSLDLKVGGPATAANDWISEFLRFNETNDVPVDFISTHHYPTDAFGKPGDDTVEQLAASRRGVLREEAIDVLKQAQGKPVYYTEWCTSSNPFDDLHDLPYAAAFIAKTVMEARGIVRGYSYWTFSDIFEENYFCSRPFHGGFGLTNIQGIPKPAYRAYQLLRQLGDEILPVSGDHPTVDAWLTRRNDVLKMLLVNSALPKHAIATERVRVQLRGIHSAAKAWMEAVDDAHANPRAEWERMGKPEYPTADEVTALERASELVKLPLELSFDDQNVTFEVVLPPQGTASITIEAPR